MKHKIQIYRSRYNGHLWYVKCLNEVDDDNCREIMTEGPDGYFGRATWDAAFAIGVAHQKTFENGIKGLHR